MRGTHHSRGLPGRQVVTRRHWLGRAVLLGGGLCGVAPRAVRSAMRSPGAGLRVAAIGVGNRGAVNLTEISRGGAAIVALVDVDQRLLRQQQARYPQATAGEDWRALLERDDIDAVVVSTPDHSHYHPVRAALERGWHVYCEKPLAQNIAEVRHLATLAAGSGAITQLGIQHHASPGYRQAAAWLTSSALGTIREVHCWTNRPLWPQGIPRPPAAEPPPYLNWPLWLGPAPSRPFADAYHPFRWRGFWDFGGGALADMGPHLIDPVMTGLDLPPPAEVSARSAPVNDETAPAWSVVQFRFDRSSRDPLYLFWYDGDRLPPRDVTRVARPPSNGALVIGSAGRLFIPQLGKAPIYLPDEGGQGTVPPKPEQPAVASHQQQWLAACRDEQPPCSPFAKTARLNETCLLGNVALRVGRPIRWDSVTGCLVDDPQAQKLLTRQYAEGWSPPPLLGE